ncbi:MAG: N-acetylmuramoyl-L-alanine amidase [Gilliamella sp.]|nr:N-acetylmuramoyl-L-alanine amidase [Gilliamella sp.]
MEINKEFCLSYNQGSSRKAEGNLLIAHSTATTNASARAIAKNMKRTYENAYTTFVVDDKEIYQVGEPVFECWGCGQPGNIRAKIQIELCEFSAPMRARLAYENYINLIREMCNKYNIPKTLDTTDLYNGVKTHNWVTYTLGGTEHTDPYKYLSNVLNVSRETFSYDLAHGLNNNVVTISNYIPGYGVNAYDSKGNTIIGSNKKFQAGTQWVSNHIYIIRNEPMFEVGRDMFIPQKFTQYAHFLKIHYVPSYGVKAYDNNFEQIDKSNYKFTDGSVWEWLTTKVHNNKVFYQVSTTEWIDGKFICGGGFA